MATDGASWADAQVPRDNFTAGDCSKHFCMLLVADYSNYLEYDETHATR